MSSRTPEPHFWPLIANLTAIVLTLFVGGGAVGFIFGGIGASIEKHHPASPDQAQAATSAPTSNAAPSPALPTAAGTVAPAASDGDGALAARKQAGQQVYMTVCFACHQPTGLGLPNMFPPLAGSDWAAAPKPDRIIRMVLHGFTGPITINGKPFVTPAPLMPPQGAALNDEQIANVLTFVRNSFGNKAAAVLPEQVKAVREAEKARTALWTEAEISKIADR